MADIAINAGLRIAGMKARMALRITYNGGTDTYVINNIIDRPVIREGRYEEFIDYDFDEMVAARPGAEQPSVFEARVAVAAGTIKPASGSSIFDVFHPAPASGQFQLATVDLRVYEYAGAANYQQESLANVVLGTANVQIEQGEQFDVAVITCRALNPTVTRTRV